MILRFRQMLRRMFRRTPESRPEMDAARAEHHAALEETQKSGKHVERVIAERHRIDAMMREADLSMLGDRLEHR